MSIRIVLTTLAVVLAQGLLSACTRAPAPVPAPPAPSEVTRSSGPDAPARYEATIRRTAHGVAHIEAADLGSLGFGEGYAQAEDHVCTIAAQILMARAEQAKHLGPGAGNGYVMTDVVLRAVGFPERGWAFLARQPPKTRAWLEGFAAGYNRYLAASAPEEHPEWCRGAEWVAPIEPRDLAAYVHLATLHTPLVARQILQARPPEQGTAGPTRPEGGATLAEPAGLFDGGPGASNGWAVGRDLSASGRGMLVANPHVAWTGSIRMWEKHLSIPGELDVYGVNRIGLPGVLIGFNEHVAWTHTVSPAAYRTLHALELVPGEPTRYRYGDEVREMTAREVEVDVRGLPEPVRRTVWLSDRGPIVGGAPFEWTTERAYAIRDVNDDDRATPLLHLLGTARARSLDELRQVHREHQPFTRLHTLATDASGEVWYVDSSAVPHLRPEALEVWRAQAEEDPLVRRMAESGTIVLDGSDPLFDAVDDPEAARPGIVPFRALPELRRTDYVFNANDSHWLVHGEVRLEGSYSPFLNGGAGILIPRSRNNALHLEDRVPGRTFRTDGRFTFEGLQAAILSERSVTADLLVPELVERCRTTRPVDLGPACAVLERWDRNFGLESRGAVLFREWMSEYEWEDYLGAGRLFAVDFDPRDPLGTPRGLAPGPLALENLARAGRRLERQGLPLDIELGAVQYAGSKLPARIPVPGATHREGGLSNTSFNIRPPTHEPVELPPKVPGSRYLTESGYPVLSSHGLLMVVEFTDDGPRAEAMLAGGQSGNPDSKHFRDQTELYSRGEWRPVLFRAEEVRAGAVREYTVKGSVARDAAARVPDRSRFEGLDEGWNTLEPGFYHVVQNGHRLRASVQPPYEAAIRRTSYGVAHIEAADLGSLGFGEGYAQAEDHLCSIADQVVRARGERAKYFGRGEDEAHLVSDIAMRALRIHDGALELLAAEPPEVQGWVEGFAAGYNRYLADTGRDAVPGWCRGEAWVKPITGGDVAALQRLVALAGARFPQLFAGAGAPPDGTTPEAAAGSIPAAGRVSLTTRLPTPPPGASNGWALGREWTESGRGMLLANPHHPWFGSNRFWEKHLRIPGELDVYGVSLIGGPGVLVGFNRAVAWTHTATAGTSVTAYAVDLVPGDSTRYRFGDDERAMTRRDVAIEVRGEPEPVRRTLWSTHHGPLIAAGPLRWTAERAYAWRDANDRNGAFLRHVLAVNRAGSLEAFQRAHAEHQGRPWVNTVAVSADGVAWYADGSTTPHLSPTAIANWLERRETDPLTQQLWQQRMPLLDGSDLAADWMDHPEARHPGVVPFREAPQLQRTDYVFNANDPYWLVHADTLLEAGISPLFGEARAPLSPRGRSNVVHLTNATPDRPAGEDGRFSLGEVQRAVLGNRSLMADLLVPDLVARCRATPSVALDDEPVDLTPPCEILARWDRRFDLGSRGAVLFREWIGHYDRRDLLDAGALFAVGFDPADPVRTPHTLAPGPRALENLARAVRVMERRGLPPDVPLGDVQFAATKPGRIPIHGAQGQWEGVMNKIADEVRRATTLEPLGQSPPIEGSRFLTEAGYPVFYGTSFLMALEYTDDGPRAEAILTYGQSGDPESEHFTDQTEMFSRKEWRPILFREEDVVAGTRREYTVSGEPVVAGRSTAPGVQGGRASSAPHTPLFTPSPCPFDAEPEALAGIDCGHVTVPENRDASGGRTLTIPVAVVRATSGNPRPEALVVLSGGPMPSLHTVPGAAASLLRRERDLVVFDYRGTGFGDSVCPGLGATYVQALVRPLTAEESLHARRRIAADCRARAEREGMDLGAYNARNMARDVVDIIEALGYDAWNIYGISFGSGVAQEILRLRPSGLRAVALLGPVTGYGEVLELNGHARSLDLLAEYCAREAACAAAFPDPVGSYQALYDRLEGEPLPVPRPAPASDSDNQVLHLSGTLLHLMVNQMLYVRTRLANVPLLIAESARGDPAPAAAVASQLAAVGGGVTGATWAAQCDASRAWAEVEVPPAPHPALEDYWRMELRVRCKALDVEGAPEFQRPVESDVPALILVGEHDPVTPPEYAAAVARRLPNATVIEIPGRGHEAPGSCAIPLLLDFFDDPTRALDSSCFQELPDIPFALPTTTEVPE
jgi:acyl-homoserine-lactone acylase